MLEAGLSQRAVALRQGVSKGAKHRTLKREVLHSSQASLPRSGRPAALDARDHRRLIREILANPNKPWRYFGAIFKVSDDTVRKAAASMGFHKRHKRRKPFLTPQAIAKRLQWVKDNQEQDWRRVIFTDESAIEMGLDITMNFTIRRAGEQYLPQHLQRTFRSSRKSLMVWGAIAHGKKWDLVRLSIPPSEVQEKGKGMNGEKYVRMVLNGPLKRAARQLRTARWRDILVVEDGAPCHTCKLAKEARSKLGIPSLIHPPSSPDLNPIENVWHLLKTKVSQLPTRATNLDMLWEQVQACWADIDQAYINKIINGMPERAEAIHQARGEVTRF
jgi:transposase